jgi:plasmid stability protein
VKLTLDLPEDLLRALKVRAVEEGKTFKALVTEYMSTGIAELEAQEAKEKKSVKPNDHP